MVHVASADRETTATVGVVEERMPMQAAVDRDVLDLVHDPLTRADGIRMQCFGLLGLFLLDLAGTARLLTLGAHGPAGPEQNGSARDQREHSTNAHRCVEV